MKRDTFAHIWRIAGILALSVPAVGLTACEDDIDNTEDLGEEIDDGIDDIDDGLDDLGDDIDDGIDDGIDG